MVVSHPRPSRYKLFEIARFLFIFNFSLSFVCLFKWEKFCHFPNHFDRAIYLFICISISIYYIFFCWAQTNLVTLYRYIKYYRFINFIRFFFVFVVVFNRCAIIVDQNGIKFDLHGFTPNVWRCTRNVIENIFFLRKKNRQQQLWKVFFSIFFLFSLDSKQSKKIIFQTHVEFTLNNIDFDVYD